MTITCKGQPVEKNMEIVINANDRARIIARATGLGTGHPMIGSSYILESYLRAQFSYNAILLDDVSVLHKVDAEVCRHHFSALMRSRDRAVNERMKSRMRSS